MEKDKNKIKGNKNMDKISTSINTVINFCIKNLPFCMGLIIGFVLNGDIQISLDIMDLNQTLLSGVEE